MYIYSLEKIGEHAIEHMQCLIGIDNVESKSRLDFKNLKS